MLQFCIPRNDLIFQPRYHSVMTLHQNSSFSEVLNICEKSISARPLGCSAYPLVYHRSELLLSSMRDSQDEDPLRREGATCSLCNYMRGYCEMFQVCRTNGRTTRTALRVFFGGESIHTLLEFVAVILDTVPRDAVWNDWEVRSLVTSLKFLRRAVVACMQL